MTRNIADDASNTDKTTPVAADRLPIIDSETAPDSLKEVTLANLVANFLASVAATLTNKIISLGSNTLSGTTAQFNTALSDNDFATLAGSETLTNKTMTTPTLSNFVNANHNHGSSVGGGAAVDSVNLLTNGGFDFAQRQPPGTLTTIADNAYSADRWKVTRENADVQYQRADATGETSLTSLYYGTYKKITNAGKFVVFQAVEGFNSVPMRDKILVWQLKMKASSAKTIRMAILELQNAGTLDSIPATFVSAFGVDSTDPTFGTNVAIITGAESKSVTTSWQSFSVSVTVPSNSKNLIAAFWTDADFSANDTLSVAEAMLTRGSTVREWQPRPYPTELLLCQRYYWKTFAIDTGPAQNVGASTSEVRFPAPVAGANTERPPKILFPVLMRAAPTVTTYNPAAANAQVRDFTAAADCSAAATTAHPNGILVSCTGNAGTAVGGALGVHLTAESEL
jgi:hypothetical protein